MNVDILRDTDNDASMDFMLHNIGDLTIAIYTSGERARDFYIKPRDIPHLIKSLKELIIMLEGE